MKILAAVFGLLFLTGIAQLWSGVTTGGDAGRAPAAVGVGLAAFAVLGWTIQLLVHGLDVWLRRRRRKPRG